MLVLEQCGIQGARELGVLHSSCHRIAAASPVMMLVEVATDGCSFVAWVTRVAGAIDRQESQSFGQICFRLHRDSDELITTRSSQARTERKLERRDSRPIMCSFLSRR